MKICKQCKKEKSFDWFSKNIRNKGGFAHKCKPCRAEEARLLRNEDPEHYRFIRYRSDRRISPEERRKRHKEWDKKNPEKIRHYTFKKKYGITLDTYNEILAVQKNKCAICGVSQSEKLKNLCVDHDHKSGNVRGLLCGQCNSAIGLLKDDAAILDSAAIYLRKSLEVF